MSSHIIQCVFLLFCRKFSHMWVKKKSTKNHWVTLILKFWLELIVFSTLFISCSLLCFVNFVNRLVISYTAVVTSCTPRFEQPQKKETQVNKYKHCSWIQKKSCLHRYIAIVFLFYLVFIIIFFCLRGEASCWVPHFPT